jgi:hypothetical protein
MRISSTSRIAHGRGVPPRLLLPSRGKYHMIPIFRCYHDTIAQNSNYKILKMLNIRIHCVFAIPKSLRTKLEIHKEKQKNKLVCE